MCWYIVRSRDLERTSFGYISSEKWVQTVRLSKFDCHTDAQVLVILLSIFSAYFALQTLGQDRKQYKIIYITKKAKYMLKKNLIFVLKVTTYCSAHCKFGGTKMTEPMMNGECQIWLYQNKYEINECMQLHGWDL